MKKVILDRELFVAKLDKLIKFVPKEKSIVPAFENILMEIKGNKMKIVAADSNMQCFMNCDVKASEDFSICVPAHLIHKTVSLFKENEVIIKKKDDKKIEISSGKSKYNITLDCMPESFPIMNILSPENEITMTQYFLKLGLRSAGRFVNEDGPNTNLTSININEVNNKMVFTAASQVMMCRVAVDPISINKWAHLNIAPETAKRVMGLLEDKGEVTVTHGDNHVCFFSNPESEFNFEMRSVTANAKFPDTESIFNNMPKNRVRVNTIELMDAVKRLKLYYEDGKASIFSIQEENNSMKLMSADKMTEKDGEEIITIIDLEGAIKLYKGFKNDQVIMILQNIDAPEVDIYYSMTENKNIPTFIIPRVQTEQEKIFSFLVTEAFL